MPALRFSLRVNNDLTPAETVLLARAAEAAGFDQFWISNDLFLRSAPALLTAAALATTRIEIGSCILNPYTIHPAELAMLAATIDELSGNRFNLGLAAGAAQFLGWVGLDHDRPVGALRETIDAIRALQRGERVARRGRFLRWTEDAYLRFPATRVTPIYVGAMGPAMLRLTGELADGALPLLFPPEHYETVAPLIAAGATGRDGALPPLDLAACIWVSVANSDREARLALAHKVAYYGAALGPLILERLGLTADDFAPIARRRHEEKDPDGAAALVDERMLAIGVAGSPEALLPRLRRLRTAGAAHLSFGPPLGPDPLRAVALLGEQVLPVLRAEESSHE